MTRPSPKRAYPCPEGRVKTTPYGTDPIACGAMTEDATFSYPFQQEESQ